MLKCNKRINELRRVLMRALTKRLGKTSTFENSRELIEIRRVLISRPNGRLGNMLLVTPLVQEIITKFPDCKIDLFVKGNAAALIFQNYAQVDRIISLPGKPFKNLLQYLRTWISIRKQSYDLVVNVDPNSSSGRLSSIFSRGKIKIFGVSDQTDEPIYNDMKHIAKVPVYEFRNYFGITIGTGEMAVPNLKMNLTFRELAYGKKKMQELTGNSKKTICLFTYATGAKCYSTEWWQDFYNYLKVRYGDYNIIEVLPAHNESQIDFAAPAFYSKDIREMAALIAHSNIFIGADSGIMHLASAAQATVIGLFSAENISKYQPYGNNSIGIDTNSEKKQWLSDIDRVISIACLRNRE